jgi:TonB-linked SusC/RagA family outer membrane protein
LIEQFNNYGNSFRSIGNIQFDYKLHFLPELKLVANFGYDEMYGRSYGDVSQDYAYPENGNEYDSRNERRNRLMDLYANYNKRVGDWMSVDLTAGYNYQDFRDRTETFTFNESNGQLVPNPVIPVRVNLQSFFARANLGFLDRYLLTLSYRRDGTSRFTDEFRWSDFPAAAFAWQIKEESFLKDSKTVSDLKLRVGWGITGQQDIGNNYPSIPLYLGADQGAQYQMGNQFYIPFRPQSYNPSLKWEETETINAGIDFGFFDNRFSGSIDVYEKRTKDLLAFVPNPAFFGFSNADNYNIGKMTNRGLELSAQVVPVRTTDWEWTVGGNVTFQDSEVTDLFLDPEFFSGLAAGPTIEGGVGNTIQNHQVGFWPNSFYVYEQAYDASGNPIDGLVIDRNGDGTISDEDRYRYKKPAADVFYGFFTNVVYKQFDFAMSWHGSWGNYIYNNVDANLGWQGQLLIRNTDLSNGVVEVLDTNFQTGGVERRLSDYYIQDASFLRLDNVTIGYTFNKFKNSDTSVRVSLAGQNLLLLTDYKGLDPEIASGVDNNLYPRPRMYTLGLTVNF